MVKVNDYEVLEELYYSEDHAWARIEDGLVRIGITDYAQKALREIVFVELPETGSTVEQGEPYGTAESVKAVSDLIAPLSGVVKETHGELQKSPELVNQDPYGDGWLLVVSPTDLDRELKKLMDFEAAKEWTKKLVEEG